MSTNLPNVGPRVKDPVASAYPGKFPEDVGRVCEGDATVEYMPASTAFKDPKTGKLVINPVNTDKAIVRPTKELAADEDEISQISSSAGDTLGGVTSKDLYHGMGKPVQGQSSLELHHNGRPGRKREREGTTQFGPHGGSLRQLADE